MKVSRLSFMLFALLVMLSSIYTAQASEFIPWRKVKILFDSKTKLFIEGNERNLYEIDGGTRKYFLDSEKGSPVVNICKAYESDSMLIIRCDRKGGFRITSTSAPVPLWWRYKARIEGKKVIIFAVSQKDGQFESGQAIEDHFNE
jgi:hypothetical protein